MANSMVVMLTAKTSFFGLQVYVLIAIGVSCVIAISLLLLVFFFCNRSSRSRRMRQIPVVSKDVVEVKGSDGEKRKSVERNEKGLSGAEVDKVIKVGSRSAKSNGSIGSQNSVISSSVSVDGLVGWGRWYTLNEMEIATRGFAAENVIGEGGYGVVYRGFMPDGSLVAVKNLFNNKGQAEQEFKVEVEAIGKVRHKNLVGLIGYCADDAQRMLVYEYVDNGNLEQWLHGNVGPVSSLTWEVRMKIAIGTAKGLAYLHEGLEPKVVHRDIKSSNILLDRKWNPKVSDFGLAKLLGSDASYVTTRVMGTFGYVAPEYASSGKLRESSDVYSFGVLLMEIISGRTPVDYARPVGEVNLVEWLKMMVGSQRGEEVVDPLIENQPSSRALKRLLLVCLRCIDLDANKRPTMGQVLHMLEADEFPFRSEHWSARDKALSSTVPGPAASDDTPFLSRIAMGR